MGYTEEKVLDWARFLATKFSTNMEGWTYSRDTGDLEHIRYTGDYTGYNHWTQRLKRALDPSKLFGGSTFGISTGVKQTLMARFFWWPLAWIRVSLRKDSHLPDGVVSGNIITYWEEDGEYIVLFGPTVGVKVLDFLEAEPENPYAKAIVAEMIRMAEKSWGEKEEQ